MKLVGIVALFLLMLPAVIGQSNPNGRVTGAAYAPDEPVALSDITLSVSIDNPSDKQQSYYLQIQVTKDGNVVNEQDFTFTLSSIKSVSFNPTFAPQDIGEHDVIIRLYDKFKINLYDIRVIKMNVISHLGPFDIIIDPLANIVRPDFLLPSRLILENMGTRGTDVQVQLSINCPYNPVTQSLTVFLPGGSRAERLLSMRTCKQEGLYDILASIMIFNRTWVSSSSQFAVNSSYVQLEYDVPDKISLKHGETYSFPVEVVNSGNQKVTGLTFIIQQIPLSWQKTYPESVKDLNPGQKALFIVNITVPDDAATGSYQIRMNAAAKEALERKFSILEIVGTSDLPGVALPAITSTYILAVILAIAGIGAGVYLRRRLRAAPVDMRKQQMLRQLKESIRKERKRE
jgi:hypothetical protein